MSLPENLDLNKNSEGFMPVHLDEQVVGQDGAGSDEESVRLDPETIHELFEADEQLTVAIAYAALLRGPKFRLPKRSP